MRREERKGGRAAAHDPEPWKTIPFGMVPNAQPGPLLLPEWRAWPAPRQGWWTPWNNPWSRP